MTLYAAQRKNLKDPDRTIVRTTSPSRMATPQKYGDGVAKEAFIWVMCWGVVALAAGSLLYSKMTQTFEASVFLIPTAPLFPVLFFVPLWRAWQRRRMRRVAQGLVEVEEPANYASLGYRNSRIGMGVLFALVICPVLLAVFSAGVTALFVGFGPIGGSVASVLLVGFGAVWGARALARRSREKAAIEMESRVLSFCPPHRLERWLEASRRLKA